MSSHEPTLLDLRGIFLLPEMSEQDPLHHLRNDHIAHAIPIDRTHMIIHTDASVFLHSRPRQEKIWVIDCPSFNFAIHLPRNILALAPGDSTILIWDLRAGQILHQLAYRSDITVYRVNPNGLEFSHDGNTVAAGMRSHNESVIALWNTKNGNLLRVLSMDEYFDDITALAFHPAGNVLAAGSFNNDKIWFWNLDNGNLLTVWDLSEDDCNDRPYDIAFSHDGAQLFAGWGSLGLRVWDVEQMHEITHPLSACDLQPSWIDVDPCGRFLAMTHSDDINDRVLILEIDSGRTAYELPGPLSRPFFSPDGQFLAVCSSRVGSTRLIERVIGEQYWLCCKKGS
jgi:WD40 repeat protein